MNRKEFMGQLEMLLQDISPEERQEALNYYNDYLDDAGKEQEMEVIRELGSPEKLAAEILSGLRGESAQNGEFRETGYADPRFEEKDSPQVWGRTGSSRAGTEKEKRNSYSYEQYDSSTGYNPNYKEEKKKGSSTTSKVLLILAIIFIGIPIVLPLGLGLAGVALGLIVGLGGLVLGLGIGFAAIGFAGVIVFICGLVKLITNLPVGFMMMGGGLIMGVIGVIGAVLFVKLCLTVVPAVFRSIVNLFRRPIHRKAV